MYTTSPHGSGPPGGPAPGPAQAGVAWNPPARATGRKARRYAPARSLARRAVVFHGDDGLRFSCRTSARIAPLPPCRRALTKRLRTMCLTMALHSEAAGALRDLGSHGLGFLAHQRQQVDLSRRTPRHAGLCARREQQLLDQGIKLDDVIGARRRDRPASRDRIRRPTTPKPCGCGQAASAARARHRPASAVPARARLRWQRLPH